MSMRRPRPSTENTRIMKSSEREQSSYVGVFIVCTTTLFVWPESGKNGETGVYYWSPKCVIKELSRIFRFFFAVFTVLGVIGTAIFSFLPNKEVRFNE